MIVDLLPAGVFSFFLVFARVGAAAMLLPGFGEAFVPPRVRLAAALVLSAVIAPVVAGVLPALPDDPWSLLILIAGETGIGLFMGAIARIMISAMQVTGMIIAFQSAMANALINDPTAAQQGAVAGAFLTTTAVLVLFATGLHHMLLGALVDSYAVFGPGALPPMGDVSQVASRVVADSFKLGVQLAAPFLVVGLLIYLGMGLLGRLMPQVQVFFIAMPAQIAAGLLMLAFTLSAGMLWFAERFEDNYLGSMLMR